MGSRPYRAYSAIHSSAYDEADERSPLLPPPPPPPPSHKLDLRNTKINLETIGDGNNLFTGGEEVIVPFPEPEGSPRSCYSLYCEAFMAWGLLLGLFAGIVYVNLAIRKTMPNIHFH